MKSTNQTKIKSSKITLIINNNLGSILIEQEKLADFGINTRDINYIAKICKYLGIDQIDKLETDYDLELQNLNTHIQEAESFNFISVQKNKNFISNL